MLSSLVSSEDPHFPTAESPSQGKPEDINSRPAAACDKGVAKATSESTEQTGPRQDKNTAKEHHSRDHRISNRGIVGGVRGQSRHDCVRMNTLENTALSFKE